MFVVGWGLSLEAWNAVDRGLAQMTFPALYLFRSTSHIRLCILCSLALTRKKLFKAVIIRGFSVNICFELGFASFILKLLLILQVLIIMRRLLS